MPLLAAKKHVFEALKAWSSQDKFGAKNQGLCSYSQAKSNYIDFSILIQLF